MGKVRAGDGRPAAPVTVRLREWEEGDLWVLRRTNSAEMTEHLGGPESESQLLARQERYLRLDGDGGRMYVVMANTGEGVGASAGPGPAEEVVGSIGFWGRVWQEEPVYETGWGVFPEFQGHGIAAAAARAVVERAAAAGTRRHLHAYPSVDHPASNAVCRRAGFTLLGEVGFEYPKGNPITCNDWRIELPASPAAPIPR
ncbi:GNAT family N-acetyltransferase [Streptomyces sp. NBC_00448]|uniref:GNAT family N-acetyltransferase n=1 Tax=Streptomyces sp. NBC_00448 TaxID=2903652 RepID=UPI002E22B5BD